MWVCKRCGSTFSDPDLVKDHGEQYGVCPTCSSKGIKETQICYVCGNATDNYELCDECQTELREEFKEWFQGKRRKLKEYDVIRCIDEYLKEIG